MLVVLIIGGWISFRFLILGGLFLANFAAALGVGLQYGPLWSLAVEEHFYMFWPLVVRVTSSRKLMVLTATACVCSPFLRILHFLGSTVPQPFTSFYTWFNLDGLFLGALLAIWLRMASFRRLQLVCLALPVAAAGSISLFLLLGHPLADAALVTSACNLAAAGFLACMLLLGSSKWSFLIDQPILKFFGFVSYGLYLVHILAFRISAVLLSHQLGTLIASGRPMSALLLRFAGGVAISTVIAYLSRRSLEERFLRIGYSSRLTPPLSVTKATSVDPAIRING
jgi:peptidoglycan/LPS O-acetylase OafA/YrhL